MSFLFPLLLISVGIFILMKAADYLVSGASSIAAKYNISPMVIGLTVVAFGTSAPELVVSLMSAASGNTNLALGNIIGSNIANILLILGASALLCPLVVHKNTVWKEIPMSFLGALILFVLGLQNVIDSGSIFNLPLSGNEIVGSITRSNGIVLLAFFIIFLYYTFGIAKASSEDAPDIENRKMSISVLMIIGGLGGLMLGSKLLVDNGVSIAKMFGVSDTLIGLTLVAVGTSLPELVTSLVAASKKKVDIAVGNVVGSNIFNIFFILGLTSLVTPLPLPAVNVTDIFVLFLTTIFLFVFLFIRQKHVITRLEGSLMLISYAAYIGFLIYRG